ncbi:hypothetical protein LOK49_LG06G02621 [Camellia lanceoleosa]|uniref:Uncharacterized protein n=1 Tax=Camellia lanceoleosa TaxID=1840588 RepID=A0ACC0HG00_9ERIC|nr:hypothetical protein LOK49_LG06G02621 [Camellia lanceoleosa]
MPSVYRARLTTFEDSEKESEYGYVRKQQGFCFGFVEFEVESAVHFEVEFWLYTYEMPHVTGIKPDLLSWVYNVGDWGKAGGCQKTMILIYFLVESHHKQSRV